MTKPTHPLTVRIDRELFDEVRAMLRQLDDGTETRHNDGVPYGAWHTMMETILREWLDHQRTRLANRNHARSYARGN